MFKTRARLSVAVVLVGALSGCGSTSTTTVTQTTTAAEPTTKPVPKPIGGGKATCTNADIQKNLSGAAGGQPTTLINATCKEGWMVLLASVGGQDSPPQTFIFQAEGPFWALQNRSKVCMPPSPVPKDLQQVACGVN